MKEQDVIEAFTFAKGPKVFMEALQAVIQSAHNQALAHAVDVEVQGEERAHYAGQLAALIDLRSTIDEYAERALTEREFNP